MTLNKSEEYYFTRTFGHIQRVQDNALYLIIYHSEELSLSVEDCQMLSENVLQHDSSKFSAKQFRAYIDFSWAKKDGLSLTDEQQIKFQKAWENHYKVENHHPERFKGNCGKMSDIEIIEMACDLQAMAQEFGHGNFLGYFEGSWCEDQSKYFYDDFDWERTKNIIRKIGNIFKTKVLKMQ